METALPQVATAEALRGLVGLARSPHLFLMVYLTTGVRRTTTEEVRLRLGHLLDNLGENLAGTEWERPFRQERQAVEGFVHALRLGGEGLVVVSSHQAGVWRALWLPTPVADRARFGPGVPVLPLLDILDEWEPVALAMVEKDRATLLLFHGGLVEEVHHFQAEVPGKHKAGGWSQARFQRHHLFHAELHLKEVAQVLEEVKERHPFRRLFTAGPPEAVALFREALSRPLREALVGELSFDRHTSEKEIRARVLESAREVERAEEVQLVSRLLELARRDYGAVAGLAPTLWALNRHQLSLLVLSGEGEGQGRYCLHCQLLLPPEDVVCPQCSRRTLRVNLWEELPSFALGKGVELEVVHGEAARLLEPFDGICGRLLPQRR